MTGITSSGFEFEINENIKEDWRFLKAVVMADSTDESDQIKGYTDIVTILLGSAGEKRLMKHVEQDGIVPVKAINQEVLEMIKALKLDKEIKK